MKTTIALMMEAVNTSEKFSNILPDNISEDSHLEKSCLLQVKT
jgi:hypothetical protein